MASGYQHLTYEDRCQIHALLQSGTSHKEISEFIEVSRSTISREIKRNGGQRGYRCKQAHDKATNRNFSASSQNLVWTQELIFLVEAKLIDFQWSPVQISGWLAQSTEFRVSHERIYQHFWQDKHQGGQLYKNLRHSGKKYNKRGSKAAGRGLIPGGVDIEQRPAIVEKKERFGDLELDTIIGQNHKGVIVSIVDRHTKFTWLDLLPDRKAHTVGPSIIRLLKRVKEHVKTLTFDNGKEFSGSLDIVEALKALTFFAKPYRSWERGLNEHTNGLVRQYFPKGTCFDSISLDQVKNVQDLLNNRPRKILNFKSPKDVLPAKLLH